MALERRTIQNATSLKTTIRESPELKRLRHKRKMLRVRLLVLFGILFVTMVGGFIYAARNSRLLIYYVEVTGNKITATSDIVDHVNTLLTGNYAYIIPKRNIYLYPRDLILRDLEKSFPRLKNISITRSSNTSLQVSVEEIKGKALWCGLDAATADMTASCYFTNENGKIVAPAPSYSGNIYPRFFGSALPLGTTDDPIGHTFVADVTFQNLVAFREAVMALGFPVLAIRILPKGEDQFILDIGPGKTAIVRFLHDDNYQTLAGNLSVALAKKELADDVKKNRSLLQYFDLRFPNKVYYKFGESTANF